MRFGWLAAAAAMVCAVPASAAVATFGFENETLGSRDVLVSTVNGITLTVTRPGSTFEFVDLSPSNVPGFGSRSLSPFTSPASPTPFIASFSQGMKTIALQFGDFGEDADTFVMNVFSGENGTGTLLATVTANYGLNSLGNGQIGSGIYNAGSGGFRSVSFIGGTTTFPNSLYYDVLTVETAAVPEPAAWAMMIVGLGMVGGVMRRRRYVTANV